VQNRKIRTSQDTGYHPDPLLRCGQAADRLFEDDARVVVEVLSPSHDPTDLAERWYAYQSLRSIETILFVDRHRHVTVHRRTVRGWTEARVSGGERPLIEQVPVDWTGIWADVDAEATTD